MHLSIAELPFTPRILGIHAKMQHGKDTVFKHLQEQVRCHHMSFANPLKDGMLPIFGGERRNYYGSDADKNEVMAFWERRLGPLFATYRKGMQAFGTELFRNLVDFDFWVMSTELRILCAYDSGEILPEDLIVFADVRYDNEAYAARSFGGAVAHVVRTNLPATQVAHSSEAGINPVYIDYYGLCDSIAANKVFADTVLAALIGPWYGYLTANRSNPRPAPPAFGRGETISQVVMADGRTQMMTAIQSYKLSALLRINPHST